MNDEHLTAADDQAVRDRALSPDHSFIVQAPAGSGKTELLIQRYLSLLGSVREPEEIVAITFTLKAAAEMRERIVEALRSAAAGCSGGEETEARRLGLARAAIARDSKQGWGIIDHPARLQIQTIDALCLSLTRQLPFLSGLSAPSGILDDPAAVYRRAAVDTLRLLGGPDEAWGGALERFLVHTDNDLTRATSLVATMLASRDQWLRHVGEGGVSAPRLETAWRGVIESFLRLAAEAFPKLQRHSMLECAGAAAAVLSEKGDTAARVWLQGEGFPGTRMEDLPRWRFIARLLLRKNDPALRAKVTKTEGFPPGVPAKRVMEDLLTALSTDEALAGILDRLRSLPDPFDPGQAGILNAMVTVLRLAVAQLELIFEESGQVDFVEVTQRAIAALGALQEPSDLALKLDYQIQHLLVDEFQDTSIAQHRLLELLTQGWMPEDGKTLFLVGDPAQSIYRFREAEVGVFLRVWERGLGSLPLKTLRLHSNFRSSPQIVQWINRTFSRCFPPVPDPQSGAVSYAESLPRVTTSDDHARVYVHPFLDRPESAQAERLAVLVAEALERSNDVAVLVRARSHLKEILAALRTRNIPYSGLDVTAVINEAAVRDLYSLTRALLHPGDRMAWLSLLRAPWCGLTVQDLLAVACSGQRLPWDALNEYQARAGMSADGAARVERFVAALRPALEQRGRLTLRQWVARAWVGLGAPAWVGQAGLKHAQSYLELLGRHQRGMTLLDEAAFRDALHSHFAPTEARAGAVQVMTIHKAKGLEFDEVFLPALERSPRSADTPLLLWEEPAQSEGLLLAAMSAPGAPEDKHYRFLRDLQAEKSSNEDDRVLYVACTRARRRLHLMANLSTREDAVRAPPKGSLLRRVWPEVRDAFREAGHPGAGASGPGWAPAEGGQPLRRIPSHWRAPEYPQALRATPGPRMDERNIEFSWAGETARQVGILVHALMQRITHEGLAAWPRQRMESLLPSWRRRLAHIGVPPAELDDAVQRTARAVRNLLEDERAAWLLSGEHAEAATEYELSAVFEGRVRRFRVDRTFVDEQGVRWIVDYKTSTHEGGAREAFLDAEVERYRRQLESYAAAFGNMGAGRVMLGLYFPLLRGWREWRALRPR